MLRNEKGQKIEMEKLMVKSVVTEIVNAKSITFRSRNSTIFFSTNFVNS